MDTNRITLNTYQEEFDKYEAGTSQRVSGTQKEWIDGLLARIDTDTLMLEVGSAFGRDAAYIKDAGYENITVTDAFDAAIDRLRKRGFADAKKFNALTDEPDGEYGLIFASAVFLHFTEREFETVLQKLHGHLGKSGLLAFTVKEGDGEENDRKAKMRGHDDGAKKCAISFPAPCRGRPAGIGGASGG